MQYNKMKIAVGIFVVVLFISLGSFIYFLLDAKGAFEKRYRYYFITDSASSFSIGMPVKFSGFGIGSIDDIKLKNNGKVKISFSITQENRKWINQYTYLLLKKPLIGSPHIEVLATAQKEFLKPNSKLPIIITDDINDMVTKLEPVVDRLLNIIKNVEKLTDNLVSDSSPLNKSLQNLETFTAKLSNSDSLLTSVTGDKDSTQALINSLNEVESILNDFKGVSKNLNKTLIKPASDSLNELHFILKDVNSKLKTLNPLIKSVGNSDKEINELKESLSSTLQKTDELMIKIDALLQDEEKSKVELP
jgi:ABC-type transporter Mla subunit MlaD